MEREEKSENFLKNRKYLSQEEINPGVYLLFCNNEVVYVGKSIAPEQRVLHHNNQAKKRFDSYYIIYCGESQLNDIETKYIQKYAPKYNKSLPYSELYPCIGKITKTKNGNFSISCTAINNKLYLDLSQVEFKLVQKKKYKNND